MKKALLGAVAVLCLSLPACGGASDEHEAAIQEAMSFMNEMAITMEGVSDKASLEAAVPKLKEIAARGEALKVKMKAMGDPKPEREKDLKAKYEPQMKALQERMGKVMQKVGPLMMQVPEAAKALQSM